MSQSHMVLACIDYEAVHLVASQSVNLPRNYPRARACPSHTHEKTQQVNAVLALFQRNRCKVRIRKRVTETNPTMMITAGPCMPLPPSLPLGTRMVAVLGRTGALLGGLAGAPKPLPPQPGSCSQGNLQCTEGTK